MQLLQWNNPGQDTRRASSMVRGAGCREINPRLRRRDKNVLDIPFYRSGVCATLRFCFAFCRVDKRNGDLSPTEASFSPLKLLHIWKLSRLSRFVSWQPLLTALSTTRSPQEFALNISP